MGQPMAATSHSHCTPPNNQSLHAVLTHTSGTEQLQQLLTSNNIAVSHIPMMSISPLSISTIKQTALHEADAWIFLSRHSLGHNAKLLQDARTDQTVIAIGSGTADALLTHELVVDYIPTSHSSQGIIEHPFFNSDNTYKVLIFSELSSPSPLKKALNKRGHQAIQIATYRQQPRCTGELASALSPIIDQSTHITAHSQRGLEHIIATIHTEKLDALLEKMLVVTNQSMQTYAYQNGFQSVICSANNGAAEILDTIKQHGVGATHG